MTRASLVDKSAEMQSGLVDKAPKLQGLLLLAVVALTGCTAAPRVEVQQVNVPIPVECKEPVPARPAMPTEALRLGATVDDFARAAMAEIERREGYEGELLTALENCRAPRNRSQ